MPDLKLATGLRTMVRRVGLGLAIAACLFVAAVIGSARGGDRTLWPPAAGVPVTEVFVVSHGYHAGLMVPRRSLAEQGSRRGLSALGYVATRFAGYDRLEIGWGDEGFYREVPTPASLTVALALRALLRPGNPSVLHVVGIKSDPRAMFPNSDLVRVDLGAAGSSDWRTSSTRPSPVGRMASCRRNSGPGSMGRACSFEPMGHFISSTSAIIGSPTCSLPPACRSRPCLRHCRSACSSISNGAPTSFDYHHPARRCLEWRTGMRKLFAATAGTS
jgi:hypothetical protein